MRYRLRTLMIVLLGLQLLIGGVISYPAAWIQQRRAFLTKQEAIKRKDVEWTPERDKRDDDERKLLLGSRDYGCRAPFPLGYFGERGQVLVTVHIPRDEVPLPPSWSREDTSAELRIFHSRSDYRRARKLFPEADLQIRIFRTTKKPSSTDNDP